MMPLDEVSVNIHRPPHLARDKAGNDGNPSSAAPPLRAVQSMLKTTTELGDLGQLGIGTSRLPRSGSRIQSSRVRSGSFDTSFASAIRHHRSPYIHHNQGRHHGPRPVHSTSTLSARYDSRSNLRSYAHSSRSRRYPSSHHAYPLRGLASDSPSLYTHRSLVTLRSNRDVYSIRSASPSGPPPRLHRPPHRAASPAFTDDRVQHAPHQRFIRAPSVGTVASAASSAYPRRDPYGGLHQDLNSSYISLRRFPSPAYPYVQARSYSGRAAPAAGHTPVGSFRAATPFAGSATSLTGIPQSPSGSTTPAYYDYSESFTEEDPLPLLEYEVAEESTPTLNQIILENVPTPFHRHAQTPFGVREGSRFHPIELPTRHNRRPSENSKPGSRHGANRGVRGEVLQAAAGVHRSASSEDPVKIVC